MRRILVAMCSAALLLTVLVPVAAAGPPQGVTITSLMLAQEESNNAGTFDASGSDLICSSGTVMDLGYLFSRGDNSGRKWQLLVDKEFGCPDGTFILRLAIHADLWAGTEVFTWVILDGTGAYSGLHGHGSGTTVSPGEGQWFNTYTGLLSD